MPSVRIPGGEPILARGPMRGVGAGEVALHDEKHLLREVLEGSMLSEAPAALIADHTPSSWRKSFFTASPPGTATGEGRPCMGGLWADCRRDLISRLFTERA